MKIKSIDILIIALTIHIFSVHTKLLYHLNPEVVDIAAFTFISLNQPNILAMVFAVAYSLATFSVVSTTRNKPLIVIFAIMDALGVLLYYFPDVQNPYKAVYFALYTGLLIISIIYLDKTEYLSDLILEMKQKGISQRDISQKLNLSESMVSRLIKRVQDEKG